MKAPLFNTKGKNVGTIDLPESVFGAKRNSRLVHQVATAFKANARAVVAHVKGRSEVSGGGKKPWAQKGTGRARHGSIRSPLWRGGGKAHGPRKNENYAQVTTKSMRAQALASVLSEKLRGGRALFVDAMTIASPKTADAKEILTGLGKADGFSDVATRRTNAALIVMPKPSVAIKKSFRNMSNVAVVDVKNVNPVDLLSYRFAVIVGEESVGELSKRVA